MPSLAMLSSCRAAQGLVGTLNPARGGPRLLLPLQLPQPHLPLQQNASTRIPFLGSRNRPRPLRPARFRIGEDDRTSSSMGSILEAGEAQELLLSAHHLLCNTERRLGDYCSTFVPSRQPPPTPSPPTSTQPNPASIKGEHPPNAYPASGPADEDDAAAAVAGAAGAGEPTTATGSRCWHLYGSFHVARQRLEADACAEVVTRGHPGPACEKLETLERLVRELQYVPTEDMYRVLRTNERLLGDLLGAGGAAGAAGDERGGGVGRGGSGPDAAGGAKAVTEGGAGKAGMRGGNDGSKGQAGAMEGQPRGTAVLVSGMERDTADAVFDRLDRYGRGWLDRDDLLAGLEIMGGYPGVWGCGCVLAPERPMHIACRSRLPIAEHGACGT